MTVGSSGQASVAELGYEAARDELAEVVRTLEGGGLTLEESLALWERGEALAKVCERHLAGARRRVEDALASVESVGETVGESVGETGSADEGGNHQDGPAESTGS